jgi:hypothetical protein
VLGWTWNERKGEYQGLCPCHESSGSHTVNAGIKDGARGVVFHCFARCTYDAFVEVLRGHGLVPNASARDPAAVKSPKKEVARYAYTDAEGATLYYNIRYQPKDFRMAMPGPNGDLTYSLKTLTRRVLYRLPRILETTSIVFFCEGEKDAETVERLGAVATCIAGGADGWKKYVADYVPSLQGQDVVLLPHNDEPGRKFMAEVTTDVAAHATRVRTLTLPGLPAKGGDVTDWVEAGGTIERLWELVAGLGEQEHSGPVFRMEATALLSRDFKPLRWFAAGLLHEGMVLFGGKSKRGKSFVALNAAVSIATGHPVFGQYEVPEPTKVLYCALEDGPRRLQRRLRLIAPGADLSNLAFVFRMQALEEGGLAYLLEQIKAGYKVIFIDVLALVESASKNGTKSYHEVYQNFAPLQNLRSQYDFALVMVTHLRKSDAEEIFDTLHGSVAYQAATDSLWVFERKIGEDTAILNTKDKDHEDAIIELAFKDGVWTFIGQGEEHRATRVEAQVIKFLVEEAVPQSIRDIMTGLGIDLANYAGFRLRLHRMVSKQLIVRTDRGKFAALVGVYEDYPL